MPSQLTVTARSFVVRSVAAAAPASASWSARARRSIESGLSGVAGLFQQPAEPAPAECERGPNRSGRDWTRRAGEPLFGLAVRCLRLVGLASQFQQPPDGGQAAADVRLDLIARPWLRRQRLARRQHLTVRRQRVLQAAHQAGQRGHLKVRTCQRKPRGRVRLPAQERPQLAVEVGGRPEQPVAQLLELVLLQQEVLADAGVERLTASTARS